MRAQRAGSPRPTLISLRTILLAGWLFAPAVNTVPLTGDPTLPGFVDPPDAPLPAETQQTLAMLSAYGTVVGSAITFIVSTLGTLATMYYGWRQEQRQSQDSNRQAQEVVVRLAALEMQMKGGGKQPPAN